MGVVIPFGVKGVTTTIIFPNIYLNLNYYKSYFNFIKDKIKQKYSYNFLKE